MVEAQQVAPEQGLGVAARARAAAADEDLEGLEAAAVQQEVKGTKVVMEERQVNQKPVDCCSQTHCQKKCAQAVAN